MKNILVLSFMHEDPLILKEFELLKEHYNKIIDYFCFPIKYYGVRATEEGETRIDKENQIIWLHTDNIKEYDKSLICKVIDCFKFIEESDIEYDVIIKGNTSSYLNLIILNNLIQKDTENAIYTGQIVCMKNSSIMNFFVRGNCICMYHNHIHDIITADVESTENKILEELRDFDRQILEKADDVIISKILINNNNLYVKKCGHVAFDNATNIIHPIHKIEDVLKVGVICCKMYNISDKKTSLYTKDNLEYMCPDIVLLKMIINFAEDHYLIDINQNTVDAVYYC